MSLIKGTHHIAVKTRGVAEFNKAISFYQDLLGMPVVRSWGEGEGSFAMLSTGDAMMEIMASGTDSPGQGALRHIAFRTDDVDACVAKVRAAGYKITMEPSDKVLGSSYAVRIAFCLGPQGEEVEFFTEKG